MHSSHSNNDITIKELKDLLDYLKNISPEQTKKLTTLLCHTFPEIAWDERNVTKVLATAIEKALQLKAQNH